LARRFNHPAAPGKAGSEDGVPAFVEKFPVAHDIAAVVRLVGHHDDDGVTLAMINAMHHGAAEAVLSRVLDRMESGNPLGETAQCSPRAVAAAVVHRDDLVLDSVQAQFNM
jgi:hypothetical protein